MPIDPELTRQLDDAKTSGDAVSAVVSIKRTAGKKPDPAVIREHAQSALARASEATGEEPGDVRVMGHMATAYVSGSAAYISELMAQPEIASAVANQVAPPRPDTEAPEAEAPEAEAPDSPIANEGARHDDNLTEPDPTAAPGPSEEGGASHHDTDTADAVRAEGGPVGPEDER
jgi:hypothetical protein